MHGEINSGRRDSGEQTYICVHGEFYPRPIGLILLNIFLLIANRIYNIDYSVSVLGGSNYKVNILWE